MAMIATGQVSVQIYNAISPQACSPLAEALAAASEEQSHTRWWPANREPSTSLENAAARVFALHSDELPFNREMSGAEYWVKAHDEDGDGERGPLGGGIHLHVRMLMGLKTLSSRSLPRLTC